MSAGIYNFIIEQGATIYFVVQVYDADGDPIDLTDYSARMQFRNEPNGSSLYGTFSSSLAADGSGLYLNPEVEAVTQPYSSGSIGVKISAYSSSLFTFSKAYYDLEIYSGSGVSTYTDRVIRGVVKLDKNVTL